MTKIFIFSALLMLAGCSASTTSAPSQDIFNTPFTHVRGECPNLNGRFHNGDRYSEVSTSMDSRGETVLVLGDAPLILDHLPHPLGAGSYVAACQKKSALVELHGDKQESGQMKIEELPSGYRLTIRTGDGPVQSEVWLKSGASSTPSAGAVAEGQFELEGEVNRRVEFSRARGSWQGCHLMNVDGQELYVVDLTTSQNGWMDKFELTLQGSDLVKFKNGESTTLTSSRVRVLVWDRNGEMYRGRTGAVSRCQAAARRIGSQVSGTVSCVLSADLLNPNLRQLTVNGFFQCKDGTTVERI